MFYVFGDIHIGDDRSNDNLWLLYKVLSGLDKKGTIILNGDCIDLIRCETFDERHFKFFDLINQFSGVIYIIGNHDVNAREKMKGRKFLFVKEFSLEVDGKKIKILHGDKVDFFARKWPIISEIVIGINSFIYKITGLDMERKIKKIKFLRKLFFNKQKKKLIKMYKDDFDCIISGHTHSPCYEELEINNKKILYMNCGDWIDHCACGIIENGDIRLESF